ncbi:MAG: S-adenosylmethionine decarboxylase [archaeon]|nr:S-adenosylmethionine decarboxylase [Nanoarchaeota archaeon]
MPNNIIIKAQNCNTDFQDESNFRVFLNKLAIENHSKPLDGPKAVTRTEPSPGITANITTEQFHATVHAFRSKKEIVVDIYPYTNLDQQKFVNRTIKHFNLDINSISVNESKSISSSTEVIECQEPNCTKRATDRWGGRRVCRDHYEFYKERSDKRLMDLNDVGS